MTPPLAVLFAQHKAAFLGAGAAGVAGLALLQRKKAAGATGASSTAKPAGTIPAAAVVPSNGVQGAYPNTSATDVYNQLEGQLERLQAGQGSQAVPVPAPVASSLFAPNYNGNYIRNAGGGFAEIESDGSLLGMTGQQWAQAYKVAGSSGVQVQQLGVKDWTGVPIAYTEKNILSGAGKITGGTAG